MKGVIMKNILRLMPNTLDLELINILKNWLPKTIIDFHLHVHQDSNKSVFNDSAMKPSQSFNSFDLELHKQVAKSFGLETIDYQAVIFGLPFRHNEGENNLYLKESFTNNEDLYPINCLTGGKLVSDDFIFYPGVAGIKTKIISKSETSDTEIIDNFSEKVWRELNNKKGFLVIHLPKNIFDNLDEIVFLAKKYRKINFIIAHMGGFFLFDERFPQALTKIYKVPNIYFDTAMVVDPKTISCAISVLGCERILFGSDAPFGYMRGEFSKQDGQTRFYSDDYWPWDKEFFARKASIPHGMVILNSILAIKQGIDDCNKLGDYEKNSIFFNNALAILKNAKPSF